MSHLARDALLDALLVNVKGEALPGVWSRGVTLARESGVMLDGETADGYILRVKVAGKSVAAKVEVWPKDEDVHCDCGDRADPCAHAVAAVVAIKNGWAVPAGESTDISGSAILRYRFREVEGALVFERRVRLPTGSEDILGMSLGALMGSSGRERLGGAPLLPSRVDFRIEQVLESLAERGLLRAGIVDRRGIAELLRVVAEVPALEIATAAGDVKVSVQATPRRARATVVDSGAGIEIRMAESEAPSGNGKIFSNGVLLESGILRPVGIDATSLSDLGSVVGRQFAPAEFPRLLYRVLPEFSREFEVVYETSRLPALVEMRPRILLEFFREATEGSPLEVLPRLVYGDPVVAEVVGKEIAFESGAMEVPVRDEVAENECSRRLASELQLKPRQRVQMHGAEAIAFVRKSQEWDRAGTAGESFRVLGDLLPRLRGDTNGVRVEFVLGSGNDSADATKVLAAWNSGDSLVSLFGDVGFAKIPSDWLREHGDLLQRFLVLRNPSTLERVQMADFVREAGGELALDLGTLRGQFLEYVGLPVQQLPADLTAKLRPYQKTGVDWLGFLRDAGLGALLADDMGLGKTIQALCAIRGRTLIIAPTSVLPAWESQIARFRPSLRVNTYYGGSRKLSAGEDVVLTSYGTLRQDRALLTAEAWDSIVLDEAQQIKNPESQITKVVHSLRGKFRIGLTGTPIENRLDDLWSQIEFVQPGLLGTRHEFQSRLETGAITERMGELRRKVKPLILRRMKREVAPELPEKTEVVLYSDLTREERTMYQAVSIATKAKIVREFEARGNVLGMLEALLRLRQICAHPALVPGLVHGAPSSASGSEVFTPSSKLGLFREQVEESLALGHSILVFSQWTSFLDLVEKVLGSMAVDYLRLDGSTPNRGELIDRFQDPNGPRVMILSLKAGGVGLTLTKADHVIILDPWWNPAVEDQAADRAHRIGQTQPVLVQRFVARDTVEDRILQLQAKKRELAAQVLGSNANGGAAMELTREDLLELLR